MKFFILKYRILTLFCVYVFLSHAVEYAPFVHYSAQDGLVSNRVMAMTQDSRGFIWAATDFGLDRFDGATFRHFRKQEYPEMIREDFLFVNHVGNGVVAAGGYNGFLLVYDPETDRIDSRMQVTCTPLGPNHLFGVVTAPDGMVYAASSLGVFAMDDSTHLFTQDSPVCKNIGNVYARSLWIDSDYNFWVGAYENYFVFDRYGNFKTRFDSPDNSAGALTDIIDIGDGKLAITTFSSQLWIVNRANFSTRIVHLPFNNCNHVVRDANHRMWFSTDGQGLWYSDNIDDSSPVFKELVPYNVSPSDMNKIYSMILDNENNLWIGTQNSGLWKYVQNTHSNIVFSSDDGFPKAVCSGFAEDENGRFLVATDGSGVFVREEGNYRQFAVCGNVTSMSTPHHGKVWVSTWGNGLNEIDLKSLTSRRVPFAKEQIVNNMFSVHVTETGDLWCGTAGYGVFRKRNGEDEWQHLNLRDANGNILNPWVYVVRSVKDRVAMLTPNGVVELRDNVPFQYGCETVDSVPQDPLSISDFLFFDDGGLFAISNKGLLSCEQGDSLFRLLDYVPKSSYNAIVKDLSGKIWLAGSNGIVWVDPVLKTSGYLPGDYTDVSKYFFYPRSVWVDKNGIIYLGANGGYLRFDPTRIRIDDNSQYFALSSLYISRVKVLPYEGVLKSGPLSSQKKITLKHNQTEVAFDFDFVDFSSTCRFDCFYRLKGYSDDWIGIGNSRVISFNHIPTGKYTLELKVQVANQPDIHRFASLEIEVLPPWWKTWWFVLLMTLLFLTVVSLVVWNRLRRMQRQQIVLQQMVDERTDELTKALSDKDRLISVIAHDLKNPMFAIVGALENWLSSESKSATDTSRSLIGEVYESSQVLQREMLNLLDWAKSKRDDIICHPTDTNVRFVLGNVQVLLHGMISDKQINLVQHIELQNCAYVDSRMLSAIVRNLLSNAIKFTPRGGEIKLSAWQDEQSVWISVADSGVGMTAEQIAILTGGSAPVSSTLGTDSEKGTGLGFRICQDYTERNNGTLQLRSGVGEGTTVTLSFPISQKLVEQKIQKQEPVNYEVSRDLFEGNTFLVVDDDPLISSNLRLMLEEYARVLVAKNGEEALAIVEEDMPDLILSDVEMPEMNGVEMAKQLYSDPKNSHIPVLFISALNDESDRLVGLLSGAIDYIPKPFSKSELLLKVANILNFRQKQNQRMMEEWMKNNASAQNASAEGDVKPLEGEQQQQTEEITNPFLKKFWALLEKRYNDSQFSVEVMAEEMCLSISTLNRRTRSLTGKTPLEILNEYRLNRALALLKTGDMDMSVSNVAYDVGFRDPSYFTRKFKDYFGFLPSKVK